jgi:ATP-dependent DNA helicase PIF1
MVENQFLERLNLLFQHVLQNKRPFGGKQVIFLGDFHQLPPVKPFEHCLYCGEPIHVLQEFVCVSEVCRRAHTQPSFKEGDKWAFKAPVWKQLDLRHVRLEQIHRQKDTRFQDILNKIRNSQPLSAAEWADLERRKDLPNDACPTRLMSRVAQVRAFNYRELAALKSQPKTWKAMDSCKKLAKAEGDEFDHSIPFKLSEHRASLRDHTFPEDLTLKVGARVVLLHNLDHERGLVNGSQGKIIGFQKDPDEIKKVLEISGGDHKDFRHISMMDYHASNIDWRPLVHFTNGVTRLIPAIAAASIRGPGNRYEQYVVCRTQVPLALAWALSIHKSQGMTLEYVEVSSRDIFESGQLYVALSRATHLNGLKLTGFSRNQLPMDANVLEFYTETKWEKFQSCEEEYLEELLAADECMSPFGEGEPTVSVVVDDTTRPLPDSPLLNASAAVCNNQSMTFQRVLGTVDCLRGIGLDTVPPRTQSGEP